ncbi:MULTISPECIES: septum formation initiator family protein [Bifidobacterium]|uniref:FtsB family cell division protein n=1 Tax=Bifidobacterium TaxID=1678 RepID=UPI001C6A58E0|nr:MULTISPECIES: septum formation initiator family protein [Bifidobacterium]MCX8647325.1 septum formation initiator family protein [Bifidobacterium sp. B4107]MCX8651504.1 septum formation initiator family protein [Bifidobacterium sp. B4111]MCX8657935.1 septum formation initiator family protein [Bifidobacterium sp. B4114]MCX8687228.1 septum formation initiator family protein [Bifidobacterium sp. B4142]QYN60572.1 septum formation initiator family protein [Bifidobacterium asteroides]
MGMAKNKRGGGDRRTSRRSSGPITFFVAIIIVALGLIQLVSTFHAYAINLSELNGLRNQQAQLVEHKRDLENQIRRWDDKAYVTAQARDRLGFVFPDEEAIRVLHPEAVTGGKDKDQAGSRGVRAPRKNSLPWYQEMAYSFAKADQNSAANGSKGSTGQQHGDGTSPNESASPSGSSSPGGSEGSSSSEDGGGQ